MSTARCALLVIIGGAMLCGRAAPARAEQADFSADRFLIGRWSCDATREGHQPAREDATYSWGLEGRWLKLSYTLTPGEPDARPVTTEAYETFDASLKTWVYVSVSSDARYGISYSDGWRGNLKVYGPAPSEPKQFKLTTTRVNDREFTEVVEVPSTGEWRVVFSLHCRKVE